MIAHDPALDNSSLHSLLDDLQNYVADAAKNGTAAHEVEQKLFRELLKVGHLMLGEFIERQGSGDLGPTFTLPDATVLQRQSEIHERPYVTIFGEFIIRRAAYSQGSNQKLVMPLDGRLQLPQSKFSHLVQDWGQMLATEQPYGQVSNAFEAIFALKQHTDSLERMSRSMSDDAEQYCWTRPAPPAADEGPILVESADGKGVPIRCAADSKPIEDHQHKVGPKPDRKRMATVGAVYSIDRYIRTPEEVLEALFHDPNDVAPADRPTRPSPMHKVTYARLNDDPQQDCPVNGQAAVFGWISDQVRARVATGQARREVVALMDGQESLWSMLDVLQPNQERIEILDLLHVTPRLWKAAKLFYSEDRDAQLDFVFEQTRRVLYGNVKSVIHSLRSLATRRKLSAKKRQSLEVICNYLRKNASRMRYDEYLAAGYPIASGVIEGACRHVVKDRLERTGMSWTRAGAQAMLNLRAIWTCGRWKDYMSYRIKSETDRQYAYASELNTINWPLAA